MNLPLVSVGVPTYNRPAGLERALHAISSQSYENLEIVVSDNCSENPEVSNVLDNFVRRDPRIHCVRQSTNIGALNNFKYVLNNSNGEYFIWAADDDEWLGDDFLAKIVPHAFSNILTFPSAVFKSSEGGFDYPLVRYEACQSKFDYLKAFCSNGLGHPVYGLYNRRLFNSYGLRFEFDEDLSYYNEGTFLHKLFLKGSVKYVKDAKILFSTDSVKPAIDLRIGNFIEYFKRTLRLYAQTSDIPEQQKSELISEVLRLYWPHLKSLFEGYVAGEWVGPVPFVIVPVHNASRPLWRKIQSRVMRAAKVLVNGRY